MLRRRLTIMSDEKKRQFPKPEVPDSLIRLANEKLTKVGHPGLPQPLFVDDLIVKFVKLQEEKVDATNKNTELQWELRDAEKKLNDKKAISRMEELLRTANELNYKVEIKLVQGNAQKITN